VREIAQQPINIALQGCNGLTDESTLAGGRNRRSDVHGKPPFITRLKQHEV
jgi:hypothetical protein